MARMFGSDMKPLLMKITAWASIRIAMLAHMLLINPQPTESSIVGFGIINGLSMRMRLSVLVDNIEVLCLRIHGHSSDGHGFIEIPPQSRSDADNSASAYNRTIGKAYKVLV